MRVVAQPFFARERSRPPLAATLLAVVATGIGASLLQPAWGSAGIAAAVSLGSWLGAALLAILAARAGWWRSDRLLLRRVAASAAATLLMGLALWFALGAADPWLAAGRPLPMRAAALGALCGGGLALYAVLALLFGVVRRSDLRPRA
jgi:putative peptidoglycan lipid II flippase